MTDERRVRMFLDSINYTANDIDAQALLRALCDEVRAEEREVCGALLGEEAVRLVMAGEHDEARIVARESARIRGTLPRKP